MRESFESCSRFRTISPMPNSPMATATKLMPSAISGWSKVKRASPELTSVPTNPSNNPRMIMQMALSSDPCASTTEATSPSTINEKYSGGPNASATLDSGVANIAISNVAIDPATKEPTAEVVSAAPARPLRAIL